jgi:aspartyl-tRNA(Asn)/glutamyl-tRNA(Gln) amidotransferase subunit C
MSSPIDKKTLEHLAELARIELTADEGTRLLHDLQKILEHFEELKGVDTTNIPPLAGGSMEKNVFRNDDERENTLRGAGVENFPEKKGGFLKIPSVFGE